MNHLDDETLNAYAEGRLGPQARHEVDVHLRGCPACRGEVEATIALREEAGALPREIPPDRDLWPGIESRLRESRVREKAAGPRRGRPSRPVVRPLLAAAALALVVGSGAWYALRDSGAPGGSPTAEAPAPTEETARLAAVEELDREYGNAEAELRAILEAGEGRLAPETMEVLEENLRIIEEAIRESREALERDPAAAQVLSGLRGMYELKLEVLRRAVRMSGA